MAHPFISYSYSIYKSIALKLRKENYGPKVFCVGFNKTGTTTFGKSMEMLGYRNTSFNAKVWRDWYKQGKIDKVLAYTAKFDSTDDLPWLKADMIPLLDQHFPNSKFVFLERDEESWLHSMRTWSAKARGVDPNMEEELENFRCHNLFIGEYFKDRPSSEFLTLDIRDPNGFSKLASFLGKSAPSPHFPHFNRTAEVAQSF